MYRSRLISRVLRQQRVNYKQQDYVRPLVDNFTKHINVRKHGTVAVDDSYVKKFMKAVGWMDQSRTRLKLTGYFLYECVPEKVAYHEWFQKLQLPDTFTSWFMVTELHVWMLMVRYMAEDSTVSSRNEKKYVKGNGYFVRNCMIEALWSDVANRIKLLQGANPAVAKKQVSELSEQFQAALVGYDEGLYDDKALAAAIWRRFYSLSDDVEVEKVESIVHIIRHQLSELDKLPSEDLQWKPQVEWLSILNH